MNFIIQCERRVQDPVGKINVGKFVSTISTHF